MNNHNPDTDIKNMTFEQLINEWEKTAEKNHNAHMASDRYKLKPVQIATNDEITERTQIKMWAIEKEIKSEYPHLIDGLKENHNDLWICLTVK